MQRERATTEAGPSQTGEARGVAARRSLAAWLPWLVTGALLACSLSFVSWARVAVELRQRPWHVAALVGVLLPFAQLYVTSACDWILGRRVSNRAVSFDDVLRARAAMSALPFAPAASGGYFVWIKNGIRPRSPLALFGCIASGEIVSLCFVSLAALGACHAAGHHLVGGWGATRVVVVCTVVVVVVCSMFVVLRRSTPKPSDVALTLRALPMSALLWSIVGRALGTIVVVVAAWAAARSFGLALPLDVVAVYVPLVVLAGYLPLGVAGFGATQASWLLFTGYAPAEHLLAFHLVWNTAQLLGRLACGLPHMPSLQRDLMGALFPDAARRALRAVAEPPQPEEVRASAAAIKAAPCR